MSSIDQTIVSLSSQTIQTGLSLDSRGIEWIVNSYQLAAAALFPVAGKLADVLGYKRMMLAGTIAFAIGSLLCGLTPQGSLALAWMIVSRVVQGAGLALMFPSAIGILFSHAPQEKRAKYMAMFFAITGGMTAIGPIAGSYLITFSWRAVFFINLPLAIAAVSLIWALTPADGNTGLAAGLASMDWPGAVLVALAMASLIIPLQQGGTVGWTDVRIIGGLLCSVILFLAFGIHESRTTRPIITIGVFRSARFSLSALATLAASMAFIPVMYFVSVYGELALDQNVLHASEFILYFFIGFMVAAQIGARIFDAHGIRRVLLVAGLLSIIGFGRLHAIAGGLDAGVPPVSALTVPLMLSGAGIGMMFSPAATDMVNRALKASYGEVTAITQMIKNFGGALGMAVFSAICSSRFAGQLFIGLNRYGITTDDAAEIARSVASGGHGGAARSLSSMPARIGQAIMDTLRASYASASGTVFLTMAAVGLAFLLIAAFYGPGDAHRAAAQSHSRAALPDHSAEPSDVATD